jgi:hypothetical protein
MKGKNIWSPTSPQIFCKHNASKLKLWAVIWCHIVGWGCDEIGRIIKKGYEISDMAGMNITNLWDYKIRLYK